MRNFNSNTSNISQDEEIVYFQNVNMFKEIEKLFLIKSNINHSQLSLNEMGNFLKNMIMGT